MFSNTNTIISRRVFRRKRRKNKLHQNELEDLKNLTAKDLHQILIRTHPKYIVTNEEEFYSKARKICQNSFNLHQSEYPFSDLN